MIHLAQLVTFAASAFCFESPCDHSWMGGSRGVGQKRASGKLTDHVPEADVWDLKRHFVRKALIRHFDYFEWFFTRKPR
jgi:hypothetical protein